MKTQTIKTNLFIVTYKNGNKAIKSYNTMVAAIEGNNIICYGSYSKTTTAHIKYISQIMNKAIIWNDEKVEFTKLPYGTKIK